MTPRTALVRAGPRGILLLLLAALPLGAQSSANGGNGAAVKPVRVPELAALLQQLDTARRRENETEMRRLATKFSEYARDHATDADAFFLAASAHDALLNLAVLRYKKDEARKELELAMDCVNRAIELDAGRAEPFALRAQLYGWKVGLANPFSRVFSAISNGGRIKENLQTALRLEPKNPAVHLSFGMEDYYKPPAAGGDLRRAVEHFKKAVECDPRSIDGWLWLGLAEKELRNIREAREAFQKVLELDGDHVRAARELASLTTRR